MFNKLFSIIILFFILTSCGPVYQTNYSYSPPEEMAGKQCLSLCSAQRQSCSSNCRDREQTCEIVARTLDLAENLSCNKRKKYCNNNPDASGCIFDKNMDCNESSGSHSNCTNEKKECKSECLSYYNECYINCGGKIDTQSICVQFCDK